ncbi:MAG TPA: hypothetical protein PL117_04670 [Accumulibacter sp.]|uniref:hypothetical protein n=1 Tax=Accumulibacter sp. TaxID=2053492 RepID=UPI002CBE97B5|nr:hypothetical protein [Accumulibacter sp.]HRD91566.1 hypothetical protein [Accumulibacter sp.]HRF72046.1 hypothetical protein [Accumulibacter sp.]
MTLPSPALNAIYNPLNSGEFLIEHLPTVPSAISGTWAPRRSSAGGHLAGTSILAGEFIPLIENNPLSGLIT